MKKLYEKEPVWFAVAWIILYVLAFAIGDALSEAMGQPKMLTTIIGGVLTAVLWGFIRRHDLNKAMGLCPVKGGGRRFLYFVPLILISSVNLWYGLTLNESIAASVMWVTSMCFVGFLEEVIFRGLLFTAMAKENLKTAVIVASVTFGAGHIVNLLLGAPLFETLLQLVYASAIGFCYTAILIKGGSLLPCILSHAAVNSLSIFAVQPSHTLRLIVALVMTLISVGYGMWLLKGSLPQKITC
ncbi:MAG: CPBP family intramembrane metalloprotease [Clostridia bacterium]|nr:CPBP family intramembrane metalloprotease [Clostridia bacterium]